MEKGPVSYLRNIDTVGVTSLLESPRPVTATVATELTNFEGDWVTPSDFAYRSAARITADAYTLLRITRPRAYGVIPAPTVAGILELNLQVVPDEPHHANINWDSIQRRRPR
jgi:hypothetical protein